MYDVFASRPSRGGVAVMSAVALLISGCDTAGPGGSQTSVEKGMTPNSRFSYREGGVDLSKNASDELADFVTAIHFDAVLPMTLRLNSMSVTARQALLKGIFSTRDELSDLIARVQEAGEDATPEDLAKLDAASHKMESLIRPLVGDDQRQRIADRAKKLLGKYPELKGIPTARLRELLLQSLGRLGKDRGSNDGWVLSSPAVDTGESSDCKEDCSITAAIDYGGIELAYVTGLVGCGATTAGWLFCVGAATALQWYGIGTVVWSLYTCTEKCP